MLSWLHVQLMHANSNDQSHMKGYRFTLTVPYIDYVGMLKVLVVP